MDGCEAGGGHRLAAGDTKRLIVAGLREMDRLLLEVVAYLTTDLMAGV